MPASPEQIPGEEEWPKISGDDEAATKRRRAAYDRWFSICTCGHGPESHDFSTERHSRTEGDGPVVGIVECDSLFPGDCKVASCDCQGYDHITGKPDHPCNPLPTDDPRRDHLFSQLLTDEVCDYHSETVKNNTGLPNFKRGISRVCLRAAIKKANSEAWEDR